MTSDFSRWVARVAAPKTSIQPRCRPLLCLHHACILRSCVCAPQPALQAPQLPIGSLPLAPAAPGSAFGLPTCHRWQWNDVGAARWRVGFREAVVVVRARPRGGGGGGGSGGGTGRITGRITGIRPLINLLRLAKCFCCGHNVPSRPHPQQLPASSICGSGRVATSTTAPPPRFRYTSSRAVRTHSSFTSTTSSATRCGLPADAQQLARHVLMHTVSHSQLSAGCSSAADAAAPPALSHSADSARAGMTGVMSCTSNVRGPPHAPQGSGAGGPWLPGHSGRPPKLQAGVHGVMHASRKACEQAGPRRSKGSR